MNPPRTRLVDDAGLATPEFYKFLVQIQRMLGGPSDPFDDQYFLGSAVSQPVPPEDAFLPPPMMAEQRDDFPVPVFIPAPDDVLPPPPIQTTRDDDLLYPPRYGA